MTTISLVDTHAHLDLPAFSGHLETLLRRSEEGRFPENVSATTFKDKDLRMEFVVLPGIDAASSRRVLNLAGTHPRLRAAVGIQPNSCDQANEEDWEIIEELASRSGVVGIGETGLDRYWDDTPFDRQIDFFRRHIALAKRLDLPILIHCREASADLLPILREETENIGKTRCLDRIPGRLFGLIHAFSDDANTALEYVRLGFFISFAGSVTYRNKKFAPLWEAAQAVPEDRILAETDSPYLTPTPYRGKLEFNEPMMTAYVVNRLAELRGWTFEKAAAVTTANARKLFRQNATDA